MTISFFFTSGGGVTMSGSTKATIQLAECLQVPVCTSYLHNDSFPKSHPLWMGPLGYQVIKQAFMDLLD
jgi:sulfoacetaldehyde acetyltransferase